MKSENSKPSETLFFLLHCICMLKLILMKQDEFTKLFKYIEEFRDEFRQHTENSKREHADIRGAVGELAGLIKDYQQEMLMLAHKVDRLERWIHEIAEKTGVKLSEA